MSNVRPPKLFRQEICSLERWRRHASTGLGLPPGHCAALADARVVPSLEALLTMAQRSRNRQGLRSSQLQVRKHCRASAKAWGSRRGRSGRTVINNSAPIFRLDCEGQGMAWQRIEHHRGNLGRSFRFQGDG